ncbi:transducin family protein/WD-40 repeat protein, putative [Medicago truncatula]|uniref:Transducin family protein/WD-40 repeat protein, putative n=1 Tax=Medicago truncatula TaxID=3880 RepID=G7IA82_MEDTR|nr:transducin family protein/WD-40 repeat protein, putative [Medicago truncatula]
MDDGEDILSVCRPNTILLFNKEIKDERFIEDARFIIRSCFGGLEHAFIVNGNEDSQVWIFIH